MRVGFDGRYAENNLVGIGKYIHHLVNQLSRKGVDCIIFYSQRPKIEISRNNVISLVLSSSNPYLFEQVFLPRALKEQKIDLYHAMGNVGIPLFSPTPSVLTVHDIIPLTLKGYFNDSKWPILAYTSYLLRTLSSCWKVNHIITITNFVKLQLIKKLKIKEEKISVVNSGIEIKDRRGKLPAEVKKGKYILNHGGIEKRKNVGRLIRAFLPLHEQFPKIKLVITGENRNLKLQLKKEARNLGLGGFVIFSGYVDEETLWSLIKNAACICFPSISEGFGAPVLEGFAGGVPVVASNTTSISEIAKDAAILVNPQSEKEITTGIRTALTNTQIVRKLVMKGLIYAKGYSWGKTVDETLKVYQHIVSKKPNRE